MSSPFGVYILKLTTYDVEKREQTRKQLLSLIPLFCLLIPFRNPKNLLEVN